MTKTFDELISKAFDTEGIIVDTAEDLQVIKTGCISLDVSLGIGGIPVGRFTEIYGPEGSGKTTIALTMARKAIKDGKKVLYIDIEKFLDHSVVQSILGETLPNDSFRLASGSSAEDNFIIAEAGIDSKEFDVIIFDSIGALAPKKEQEDDFDDGSVALVPRLLSKFLRRNAYKIRENNIAFVFINQVRDKVGTFFAQGYSTPGGHAVKHFASIIIALTKGKELSKGSDKDKVVYGLQNVFSIKKNKLAPPFRSYHFPIVFGKGIDYYRDLLDFSTMLGIIKKSGPYLKLDDVNLGKGAEQTMQNLANPDNKDTLDRLETMVYNITKKSSVELVDLDEPFIEPEEE